MTWHNILILFIVANIGFLLGFLIRAAMCWIEHPVANADRSDIGEPMLRGTAHAAEEPRCLCKICLREPCVLGEEIRPREAREFLFCEQCQRKVEIITHQRKFNCPACHGELKDGAK